eukprot:Phypoly_transcript_16095.p1 GENE.Phypoly_transcript_16095~~Phypoly_transcript_16095.p1  ORF type:complete len:244 (+),score=46.75 Phypoly_transcript_16095:141-872(+)
MAELQGKIALVTGGSRGIGKAVSIHLAKLGVDVAVNYKSNVTEANKVVEEIVSLGRRAIAVQADVSISGAVNNMIAEIEGKLGKIYILVNNAGIAPPKKIDELTEQIFDETMTVNVKSVFLVTQAVLPNMRNAKWGRIINMSSVAAYVGGVVGPHYAASKAAIIGLTNGYASQLASEGITVNAICPALVESDMLWNLPSAKPTMIPVGRFGKPEEVAEVVGMLAGNAYMTGQTINVDGGLYKK